MTLPLLLNIPFILAKGMPMFFHRQPNLKKNVFRAFPRLEVLEDRLVPAGEFSLHSLPGATKVIYLDFDGHTTSNTGWLNGATIVTPAYDIDNNPSSFNPTELNNIRETWERVAEDYLPFNVDVTTEDPGIEALRKTSASDTTWGIRCVIGENTAPAPGAGGVAFLNSFSWNTDTPCFVFSGSLGGVPKNMAEAASHEVGHTLNLGHDGDSTQGYYPGHGSGPTGWAPIMGVGYYKNLSQWSKGEYSGANQTQDDLAIITNSTNGFGYRNDDYGSTIANASNLVFQNPSTINTTGIIERNTDQDFFRFILTVGGSVSINVDPAVKGPNLDIEAKLYNSSGTVLSTSNPTGALNASFNTTLAAGTYYISIDGVGEGNVLGTGYSDYGSLGFYSITGTVPDSVTPPVITGPTGGPGALTSSKAIPENSTAVHTFTANKGVTWSLAGGSDASKFTINPSTGALSFITAPDYENPTDSDRNNIYNVIVSATVLNGPSSQQAVSVTVTNVMDDPPKISGPSGIAGAATSTTTINENTAAVFTYRANTSVTWSISGGADQSWFTINPSTGALTFIAAPNYERPFDSDKNNSYIVTIRATDFAGYTSTQTTTVFVKDVFENHPSVDPNIDRSGAKVLSASATGLTNGIITGLRIVFDEPVDPSSFSGSDITFTGPTGTKIQVNNPIPVANTNNKEFTVSLATDAFGIGTYNLQVGPYILDRANNLMNQDGDGLNGEPIQDVFNTSFNVTTNNMIINNSNKVVIRDNTKTTSQITISQNVNIRDLNIVVNISHTYRADLVISIQSPSGRVVTLSNRRGGWGADFLNTLFDDSAASKISNFSSTSNSRGSFAPESSLGIFNGTNAKGTWTLIVEDKATGDTGTLNGWSLNILTDTNISSMGSLSSSNTGLVSAYLISSNYFNSLQPANFYTTQNPSTNSTKSSNQSISTPNVIQNPTTPLNSSSNLVNSSRQQILLDALFRQRRGFMPSNYY